MALIAERSVEEVRAAADLVELIRGRVDLVRRGGRWWGRCPFHEERTPSFCLIPPENTTYYCHGCGASGDAIAWMQDQEGAAGFVEAIEGLAERFGVNLSYQEESSDERAERAATERRRELLARAATFYAEYLWRGDDAAPAREYLAGRGFDEALCRRFGVGYAPGSGDALAGRALRQGFTRQQLSDAGLARLGGGRATDFFAARIMFPIADGRGRVQGFGGRTLDPGERAKYVNSPEGEAFRKRRLLFGLASAREAAARAGGIVVAEGYTDVLGLAAAGIDAAVACMGTSLTSDQLRLLARSTSEVRLCFDADPAGEEAAWRTVEAAAGIPLRLSAVQLPHGRDPGDLAADAEGRVELVRAVEASEPLLASLIRSRAARAGESARARDDAVADIAGLLERFPDSVEKDEGVRLAAGLLRLSQGMERRLLDGFLVGARETAHRGQAADGEPQGPRAAREQRLLALALADERGEARQMLDSLPEGAFEEPAHREAFRRLRDGVPPESWPAEDGKLLIQLRVAVADAPPGDDELSEAVYRLQEDLLQRRVHVLREQGDDAELMRALDLLARVRERLRSVG